MHSHAIQKISDIMILKIVQLHTRRTFMPLVSMKEMLIDAKRKWLCGWSIQLK